LLAIFDYHHILLQ